MTIQDFHNAIDIELDKTLDFEYPYILPEKKDYWLNKAQERFIKSRAFGNNLFKTSFEETEKRIDDLRTIIVQSSPITPSHVGNNYISALPEDYIFLFRHLCKTTNSLCSTPNLVCGIQVKNDEINILNKDPFWEAQASEPLYYVMGNSIIYETNNDFVITSTIITYLRTWAKFQYGSQYIDEASDTVTELPEHTHQEIVDIAVSMLLENIESPRYQTNLSELTKIE